REVKDSAKLVSGPMSDAVPSWGIAGLNAHRKPRLTSVSVDGDRRGAAGWRSGWRCRETNMLLMHERRYRLMDCRINLVDVGTYVLSDLVVNRNHGATALDRKDDFHTLSQMAADRRPLRRSERRRS